MNTLGGAGAAYLVRGDARYLDILRNAYDYFQAHQVFATGCYGPDEQLLPRDALLAAPAEDDGHGRDPVRRLGRVQDGQVSAACTGDARYGDWAERIAINGLLAGIPMQPDGRVFYYSNYNPRGGANTFTARAGPAAPAR